MTCERGRRKPVAATLVAGAALPWCVGAVCSLLASVDYGRLVDFDVCRQSVVYRRHVDDDDAAARPTWTSALAVAYWAAITAAGVWLVAGYSWNRKQFGSTLLRRDATTTSRDGAGGLARNERRRTSCISGAGASLSDVAAAGGDQDDVSRHNSSRKRRTARRQSGERVSRSSQVWTYHSCSCARP